MSVTNSRDSQQALDRIRSMTDQELHDELFHRIVANYDDARVPCQHVGGCKRTATWVAVFHNDCPSVTVCTAHKNKWIRNHQGALDEGRDIGCYQCGERFFFAIDELVTFRRLDGGTPR